VTVDWSTRDPAVWRRRRTMTTAVTVNDTPRRAAPDRRAARSRRTRAARWRTRRPRGAAAGCCAAARRRRGQRRPSRSPVRSPRPRDTDHADELLLSASLRLRRRVLRSTSIAAAGRRWKECLLGALHASLCDVRSPQPIPRSRSAAARSR
jgi:hypothetical protein